MLPRSRQLGLVAFFCLASALVAPAQSFKVLFSFNGTTNGSQPNGPLVQGFDGNLYGTTPTGGAHSGGTVFKITTAGVLTTVYSFCAQTGCTDGEYPRAGLVLGKDGNFYGTTTFAGLTNKGTLFKITPQGKLTTLYSFCPTGNPCLDGYGVMSPLIQGTDGNFYGAATEGGGPDEGTAFKITPAGAITVLHRFCTETNCNDGAIPNGLVQATDGKLYGTTQQGPNTYREGVAFRLTTTGTLTALYDFFCDTASCIAGYEPHAGLIQGSDGDLYGTTLFGGGEAVFQLTLNGALTPIYSFGGCAAPCASGVKSESVLTQGTDGKFYGTTDFGGSFNGGTLFNLTPSGILTVLHNFPGWRRDYPGVMQATDGNFYGTTVDSSTGNYYGVVFKETMGLGPFVKTVPTSGLVGAKITILGTNLTGTSAVSFNGTPSTFTIVSATEVRATVPTGATTGKIAVVTPTKTLHSNVAFQVR